MEPGIGVLTMRHLAAIALLSTLLGCEAGGPSTGQGGMDTPVDLSGIWLPDADRAEPWPEGATLTPEAESLLSAYTPEQHDPTRLCMPFGTPRNMLQTEYPLEIVQTADRILMILQPNLANSEVRRIPLNAAVPEEAVEPSWFGTSRGRWEGEALVVETVGMRRDAPISGNGVRHGGALRLVERLHVESDPERGRVLVNELELLDPATFTAPVKLRRYFVFAPQAVLHEPSSCIELEWIDKLWRQRLEEHAQEAN